jgi:hypothetical protein
VNRDPMCTLLDAGVPQPPAGLLAPPIATIRHRARRRRAAVVASAATSCLLAAAGIAMVARGAPDAPAPPASSPASVGTPTLWSFVVVDRDDRSLRIVGGPPNATDICDPGQVTLRADRDPLVLTSFTAPTARNCQYEVTWRLDAPLRQRAVLDGLTNTPRPVLHESILPHPTYPTGLSLARELSHLTLNAPRPSWTIAYTRPDQTVVMVSATPLATAADIPVSETIMVHGHKIRVWDRGPDGANSAVWETGDWQVSVLLDGPNGTGSVSRAEFRRVLDGLVWS